DVHHALQMPEHDAYVSAAEYLKRLCVSISRSRLDHMKIKMVLAASPLQLQSDRCWRLGMIVYELITNAARHAFTNGSGEIRATTGFLPPRTAPRASQPPAHSSMSPRLLPIPNNSPMLPRTR